MTNVDVFKSFADGKGHYFHHCRKELDFANLFDTNSSDDSQLKMIHFTEDISPTTSSTGMIIDTVYKGAILALYKSDLDELIDDKDSPANGKYEKYVKPLIDNGGLVKEMYDQFCIEYAIEFSSIKEIYNFFDMNGDGIWIRYKLTIEE